MDINNPVTPMDISTKQKIDKEIQALNETIGQLDLIDIHRAFHPKIMDFTIFACTHGTFPRIDHILVHKSSLGKLKNKKNKKTKQNKKKKTKNKKLKSFHASFLIIMQ